MKGLFSIVASTLVGFGIMATLAGRANAYYSCDRYSSWSDGYYTVFGDAWYNDYPNYGTQCITVNNAGSWTVSANFWNGGIKSYPNTSFTLSNTSLNAYSAINTSFNFSVPSSGATYDVAYDLWTTSDSTYTDEIMIWQTWNNSGPIAYNYTCSSGVSWACPIYTGQYIDGSYWDVYQGNSPGHNTISFLRSDYQRSSGSQNVLAFTQWCANHNLLNYKSLYQVQFGVEITATNGSQNFSMNSFSSNLQTSNYSSNISNGNHAVIPQNATSSRLDANGWNTGNGTKVQIWNGSTQTWAFTNKGNGIYQIAEAWNTGSCLDVNNGGGSGSVVQIWSCWGGSPQQWGAISSGSVYQFEPQCALGTRLDVWGAKSANGTQVGIYTANGNNNQKWAVN